MTNRSSRMLRLLLDLSPQKSVSFVGVIPCCVGTGIATELVNLISQNPSGADVCSSQTGARSRDCKALDGGSFSVLPKPMFASKYAFVSSRRDLRNALLCTALQSHFFVSKKLTISLKNC